MKKIKKISLLTFLFLLISSVVYAQAISDIDGDGIPDNDDLCLESDLSLILVIDGCDTDVDNYLFIDTGCTMSDYIDRCAYIAKKHIQFVKCVSGYVSGWQKQGLITKKEKKLINTCAQQAAIP